MTTGIRPANTLTLLRASDGWLATYTGPHAKQVRQLFGTDCIPTAYAVGATARTVLLAVATRNPGCMVLLHESHHAEYVQQMVDALDGLERAIDAASPAPAQEPSTVCGVCGATGDQAHQPGMWCAQCAADALAVEEDDAHVQDAMRERMAREFGTPDTNHGCW